MITHVSTLPAWLGRMRDNRSATRLGLFPPGGPVPGDVPSEVLDREREVDYNKWAQATGAVAAQDLSIRLTVRALSNPPVLINGLRADVVRREEAPAGWFLFPDVGCGFQPVRQIRLDLDAKPVRAEFLDVDEATGEERPGRPDLTLRVSPDDPEVLEVNASTVQNDVQFTLTLLYQSESGSGEFLVGGDLLTPTWSCLRSRPRESW